MLVKYGLHSSVRRHSPAGGDFRTDRLTKIAAGETPLLLPDTAKIALHIVPFNAFDPGTRVALFETERRGQRLSWAHPIATNATSSRYNFDGILRYGDGSYVQFFRNGCIEAVDSTILRSQWDGRLLVPGNYEHEIVTAFRTYLGVLEELAADLPFLLMLSLIGVQGYMMAVPPNQVMLRRPVAIDRDVLAVPEVLIERYDAAAEQVLKPAFDTIWNAAGWSRSHNYDDAGNWLSPYRTP